MAFETRIEIELNGVDSRLKEYMKGLNAFQQPLNNSATYMESSIGKRFRSGGGSQGKWKALSPNTIKRHPHRAGGKPLNDNGLLKMSVTGGATKRVSGKRLYYGMGTGVVYGASHNFGYKHIPQRQFLYFDDKDERAIKRIFEDYIKELFD